ncbi:transposase [Pseudomonas sp. MPG01]|jgi:transposase
MRQRSSYPKPFKAQVVQECLQPGAIVSSVAINHGINANVVRKWMPLYRDQPPSDFTTGIRTAKSGAEPGRDSR